MKVPKTIFLRITKVIPSLLLISTGWMEPQLLKPAYGDTLNYLGICFQWTQVPAAVEYELQISEQPDFAELTNDIIDSTLAAIITNTFQWGTEYHWRVRSISPIGEIGEWSDTGFFTTEPIPLNTDGEPIIPAINTDLYLPEEVSQGITILDQLGQGYIFGVDLNGNPVWYVDSQPLFDNGFPYLLQFTYFLPSGNIIGIADGREIGYPGRAFEMTIENELVWEGPDDLENLGVHHDVIRLPNGNTMALTTRDTILPVPDGASYPDSVVTWRGDRIVEWDEIGNEVWSWDSFDYYSQEDWIYDIFLLAIGLGIYDWTHSNAIWYDEVDDAVYLSVRYMSRITKIDHSTGDIIWNMGMAMPSGDVMVGNDLNFSRQHSIKMLENRNLMLFDNGNENDPPLSRGLEISITETDSFPEAEIVWEYILPEESTSGHMSDCDRLPNGNSLLTSTDNSHIVEVNPDSQIVWEVSPNQDFSTYRGERIPGLHPNVYSVIQPDFIEGENGPTLILQVSENIVTYSIHNEGWQNNVFTYNLSDNAGWFSESGSIEIHSGDSENLNFSGSVSYWAFENVLTFTITPSLAPNLEQSYSLNLEAELSVIPSSGNPDKFEINAIYPNPFNSQMVIEYELPIHTEIDISIYTLNGTKLANLFSGFKTSGNHTVVWAGNSLSSGIYLVQLNSPKYSVTQKAVLLK